eukprot:5994739-Pyramimonas_sp.AAC.1
MDDLVNGIDLLDARLWKEAAVSLVTIMCEETKSRGGHHELEGGQDGVHGLLQRHRLQKGPGGVCGLGRRWSSRPFLGGFPVPH